MWTFIFIIFILTFIFATLITSIESAKPKVYTAQGKFGSVTFETKKFSDVMLYSFYLFDSIQTYSLGTLKNGMYTKLITLNTNGNRDNLIVRGDIRNKKLVELIKKNSLKLEVNDNIYDILGIGKNNRLEL